MNLSVLIGDKKKALATLFFITYFVWWLYIQYIGTDQAGRQLDFFTVTYGVMAFLGGIWGLYIAQKWGGLKSLFGKSIAFFSIGLLLQEYGQLMYTYFIYVEGIDVPYPSLGDVGYFGSVLFYILGAFYLALSSGITISFTEFGHRLSAFFLPSFLLVTTYLVFLNGYEFDFANPVTVILDFGYPFGQAIYLSITLLIYLISKKLLGGLLRDRVLFLLFALLLQYFADFMFLYQASKGIWSVSGLNDLLYFISYFVMTLSILRLGSVYDRFKVKK